MLRNIFLNKNQDVIFCEKKPRNKDFGHEESVGFAMAVFRSPLRGGPMANGIMVVKSQKN